MVIKNTFQIGSPVLVNFDFQDILADIGYVTVFAMKDLANAETLIRQQIESDEFVVEFTPSAPGLQGENNFDYEFRTPQRLDGLCYVTITYFGRASSAEDADCQVKARLIHVDTAASETEIAAQQASGIVTETSSTSSRWDSVTFSFDINKAFAKGEKLRLEVEVYAQNTTNAVAGYFIDPANRDFGQEGLGLSFTGTITPSSQLKVLMPFPLEE